MSETQALVEGTCHLPANNRLGTFQMCHHYDFLVCLIGTDLLFSNFLNFYSSLGIDHDPPCSLCSHDLCLFPFSYVSFFTRSHGQEKSLSYYDPFKTSEYYSTDTSPPSFSSISSTTPPPLYSPSMLNNNGPTWRRTPPGQEVWSSRRSRLYLGGLASLQTRHCQDLMGPSIKEVSTAGCMTLSGTLTGLGKVQPPIVVRRVVPTRS